MRKDDRAANQLRNISIQRHFTDYAEGSVLVCFGNTKVLCNASVVDGVPRFLKGMDQGWLTAEYSMLPRATHERHDREASRGKQSGRTLEIQRLIGRSLRACVDLKALSDVTINIDCDVIQADGGTRTASITGAMVALIDALDYLKRQKRCKNNALRGLVAAVSVGIVNQQPILDLNYAEDSNAETDMNVVMNDKGEFIEIQGTAEGHAFNQDELNQLLDLAKSGISSLFEHQKNSLTSDN